ncbi:hypothetical protein U1Q18_008637 [Sarracenia purpurea var. burkii]
MGELCEGLLKVDSDMTMRIHMRWARIKCVGELLFVSYCVAESSTVPEKTVAHGHCALIGRVRVDRGQNTNRHPGHSIDGIEGSKSWLGVWRPRKYIGSGASWKPKPLPLGLFTDKDKRIMAVRSLSFSKQIQEFGKEDCSLWVDRLKVDVPDSAIAFDHRNLLKLVFDDVYHRRVLRMFGKG